MYPKQSNPTRYKGRAPYNFVPLPDKVVLVDRIPAQDVYTGNTGYIKCLMTTESPLYTRCAMSPDFFKEDGDTPFYKLYPDAKKNERGQFFHLKDKDCPLIPGSSLRGMVRTLVEIAGYGKVQWITDKKLIYRGVGDRSSIGKDYRSKLLGPMQRKNGKLWFEYPQLTVCGGYLKKKDSKWCIQPAKKINGETFVHVEYDAANCGFHNPKADYTKADLIDIYLRPPKTRTEPRRSNHQLTLHLAIVEKMNDVSKKSEPGFEKAVLVRSGDMNNKHMHCAIYELAEDTEPIDIPDQMWSLYKEDREEPRGFKTRPLKNDGDPLFYLVDDKDQLVFFGPTMMFRLPYDNPVNNFVPTDIRKPDGIDLAESIFGYADEMFLFNWDSVIENDCGRLLQFLMDNFDIDWAKNAHISKSDDDKTILISVGENSAEIMIDGKKEKASLKLSDGRIHNLKVKNENGKLNIYDKTARSGRVFFTDAKLESARDGVWLTPEPLTPNILASPKPTTVQHYLVQESTRKHDPDDRRTLAHYDTPSPDETVIRGSKRYWHKNSIGLDDIKEHDEANIEEFPKVYTRIRPVEAGVTFSFRIYFENLKDNELGALLWPLNLSSEKGKDYRHTLGMGKPFGMGEVIIKTELYISDRNKRYNQLFEGGGWAEGVNKVLDLQHFTDEFEKFVLKVIDPNKAKLCEVERIKMLLTMMEWPGPSRNSTRYLEPDEYSNRNVLPDPLNVKRH